MMNFQWLLSTISLLITSINCDNRTSEKFDAKFDTSVAHPSISALSDESKSVIYRDIKNRIERRPVGGNRGPVLCLSGPTPHTGHGKNSKFNVNKKFARDKNIKLKIATDATTERVSNYVPAVYNNKNFVKGRKKVIPKLKHPIEKTTTENYVDDWPPYYLKDYGPYGSTESGEDTTVERESSELEYPPRSDRSEEVQKAEQRDHDPYRSDKSKEAQKSDSSEYNYYPRHRQASSEYEEPYSTRKSSAEYDHYPRKNTASPEVQMTDQSPEDKSELDYPYEDKSHEVTRSESPVLELINAAKQEANDRVNFHIHGHKGPDTYVFGYDTGKGNNRQFRYEERHPNGSVTGNYGYYDANGKLRKIFYSSHPINGYESYPM